MATTTNYGWTTPDDTALVKDGASAIRTLGSSVDTTTKNLNPETTLGDIAYRSSTANVKTRLGLGTAGQVLTVNSGANAPEWATVSAGGMTLLSTTSLSGVSTTVSAISGSYTDLKIVVYGVNTTGSYLQVIPNATGTSYVLGVKNDVSPVSPAVSNYNDINPYTTDVYGVASNAATILITDYANTTYRKPVLIYGNNNGARGGIWGGIYNSTSAITSMQFKTQDGSSTFSAGTALIYGVK